MATDPDDLSPARRYQIMERGYENGNILQRLYWRLVGWPSPEEVLHRRRDSPFSLAEEKRIREIVREERES